MSSATQEQMHLDSIPLEQVANTVNSIKELASDTLAVHRVRQVRRKQYQPIGLVLGLIDPNDGSMLVGWSLCRKDDKYSDLRAMHIAMHRAAPVAYYLGLEPAMKVPHTLRHAIKKVIAKIQTTKLNQFFPEDEPVVIRQEYLEATIEQGYEKFSADNPKQRRKIMQARASGRLVMASIGA